MTLWFIRIFFLILCGLVGYFLGNIVYYPTLGWQIGCLSGLLLIFLEGRLKKVSVRGLSSMVFGLLLGVFMAKLISDVLALVQKDPFVQSSFRVILTLVFSYLGAVMALRGRDEFSVIIPYVRFRRQDINESMVLLDTSAIIDGRIVDICRANFLSGRLIVPRFVLHELQKLADSSDDIKRQKGRRGLEILAKMQEDINIDIQVREEDVAGTTEVDTKLIRLAKVLDAKICTTDFNLAQIASLQKIDVLNIHELVSAVKSVIFTGEQLPVNLIKEGKEKDQAVAFLDDGTMIVVSDAKDKIGKSVNVEVTSVLQTQTGKMIFAKLIV